VSDAAAPAGSATLGGSGTPTWPPGAPAPGEPLGAPVTGSTGAGTAGAGVGNTADAASGAIDLDALASLVLGSVDDELPSSPVYDTDTTPD
jgi:hypothetical protein